MIAAPGGAAPSESGPLRVLHVIGSADPRSGGPIEGILQQSAHRLRDDVVTELATLDDPDAPWVRDCPVRVFALGGGTALSRRLGSWLPFRRYGYTGRAVPWLRAHVRDYDVVVVNGLWNYTALAARRVLPHSGVPYVVFTHGMLDPWFRVSAPLKTLLKQVFWWFSEGPLLAGAGAVLFTTEDERMLARNAFWPYRVRERVVGYGTSDIRGDPAAQLAVFRAAVPSLGDRPFLLYLSRIHPKKGCDLLLDAFASVAAAHPDLDLVMAGPGHGTWVSDLQAQARRLGIAERVHWTGMVAGDVKWGAFRGCEAFVLPSHQENFGIVVAEALAAARPVLITNKVNIWHEVEEGGAGIVEPDTPDGVSSLLGRFLALEPRERAEMGRRGRDTFLARFEISRTARSITAVLAEIAAAGR